MDTLSIIAKYAASRALTMNLMQSLAFMGRSRGMRAISAITAKSKRMKEGEGNDADDE